MGDRISISFTDGDEESVCLFSHWGGKGFLNLALKYVFDMRKDKMLNELNGESKIQYPLDRGEPNTIMVDFIRHITKNMKIVNSDYYLGATCDDGDNSDNGHFTINVLNGEIC